LAGHLSWKQAGGRDNVMGFKVDAIRGAGEFRNGSNTLKKGVEHVLELIMEEEFGVVRAFEKVITKKIKGFSTGAVRECGRKKGNVKFTMKKK
jgi:hypothetical protein